ncbi:putative Ubiquitin-like domain-containing protein [Helianthus debilis subsp. tardiflorus]
MRTSKDFMKIFIKAVTGKPEDVTLEVKPSYTIGNIKAEIQDKINIPCNEQALIFGDVVLETLVPLPTFTSTRNPHSNLCVYQADLCVYSSRCSYGYNEPIRKWSWFNISWTFGSQIFIVRIVIKYERI